MNNDVPAVVAVFVGLIFAVLSAVTVQGCTGDYWRRECVERGVARWVTDSSGNSTFEWIAQPVTKDLEKNPTVPPNGEGDAK